jgi:hypothetical protein
MKKGEKAETVPMTEEDVERWFQKWFHNAPGISDSEQVFSRVRTAANDLKVQLTRASTNENQ